MMAGLKIAVLLALFIYAISSIARGVSVSCMMAYDEGGAPGVFRSLECPQWALSAESLERKTGNCQFATLQGHRDYQEDRVTCNLDMKMPVIGKDGLKEARVGVLAVFDGHGGKEASEMASKKLLDYFFLHVVFSTYKQALPDNDERDLGFQGKNETEPHVLNIGSSHGALQLIDDDSIHGILKEALLRTINDIDMEFSLEAFNNNYISGSTATVVLLLDGELLVANVGDSKALLCSERILPHQDTHGGSMKKLYAEELTRDHHPDRDDEKARIKAAGGFIRVWGVPRVNGILAVSRSIGDVNLKRYGVIAVPEVIGWQPLTTNDIYLVIASDGIFESSTPQNVCDLIWDAEIQVNEMSENSSPCLFSSSLADCIVNTALRKGSRDNLSAIVVPLRLTGSSQKQAEET